MAECTCSMAGMQTTAYPANTGECGKACLLVVNRRGPLVSLKHRVNKVIGVVFFFFRLDRSANSRPFQFCKRAKTVVRFISTNWRRVSSKRQQHGMIYVQNGKQKLQLFFYTKWTTNSMKKICGSQRSRNFNMVKILPHLNTDYRSLHTSNASFTSPITNSRAGC